MSSSSPFIVLRRLVCFFFFALCHFRKLAWPWLTVMWAGIMPGGYPYLFLPADAFGCNQSSTDDEDTCCPVFRDDELDIFRGQRTTLLSCVAMKPLNQVSSKHSVLSNLTIHVSLWETNASRYLAWRTILRTPSPHYHRPIKLPSAMRRRPIRSFTSQLVFGFAVVRGSLARCSRRS